MKKVEVGVDRGRNIIRILVLPDQGRRVNMHGTRQGFCVLYV